MYFPDWSLWLLGHWQNQMLNAEKMSISFSPVLWQQWSILIRSMCVVASLHVVLLQPKNKTMNKKWDENILQERRLPTIQEQLEHHDLLLCQHVGEHRVKKHKWKQKIRLLKCCSKDQEIIQIWEELRPANWSTPNTPSKEWVTISLDFIYKLISSISVWIVEVRKSLFWHTWVSKPLKLMEYFSGLHHRICAEKSKNISINTLVTQHKCWIFFRITSWF